MVIVTLFFEKSIVILVCISEIEMYFDSLSLQKDILLWTSVKSSLTCSSTFHFLFVPLFHFTYVSLV